MVVKEKIRSQNSKDSRGNTLKDSPGTSKDIINDNSMKSTETSKQTPPKKIGTGKRMVICPNEWCTHNHVVADNNSMDRALQMMKRYRGWL